MVRQLSVAGVLLFLLLPSETHAQDPSNAGRTRTYYIAADEVE